ncbi:MAG: hypothetical protein JNK82_32370, partial [Myxococcaceae bacterium]|nr:hypothetical protein [Myxococcaceae bacterium]
MRQPCAICGQLHAADAPCPTVIRPAASGTMAMESAVATGPQVPPPPPELPRSALASPPPIQLPVPQVPELDPLIGSTIGSFRIIRMVGKGGMGTVYLGEQTVIGSKVAIKILHP